MKTRFSIVLPFVFIAGSVAADGLPPDLIAGLSSESFQERQSSQRALLEWLKSTKEESVADLLKLSVASDDPEVRVRCMELLKELSDADYFSRGSGFLGITLDEVITDVVNDDAPRVAIVVTKVIKGSPAERSGLRAGDLILSADSEIWRKPGATDLFRVSILAKKPMDKVILAVKRGNDDIQELIAVLGKNPLEDMPNGIGAPELLDQMARDRHFKMWLEKQRPSGK